MKHTNIECVWSLLINRFIVTTNGYYDHPSINLCTISFPHGIYGEPGAH